MSITGTVGEPLAVTPADMFNAAGVKSAPGLYVDGPTIPGVTVDPQKGVQGTPTEPGTWTFTVTSYGSLGFPTTEGTFTVEVAAAPAPEPVGDGPRLATRVCGFLGVPAEGERLKLTHAHLSVVNEFIRGYVQGNGYRDSEGHETEYPAGAPLQAVLVSATARYVVNPSQATRETMGSQSIGYASLEGFTLAELGVLRRYRRTAA